MRSIKIPRWDHVETNEPSADLHIFTDSSKQAYGAVAYLVFKCANYETLTSLISSEARVTPLKPTPVTRLELQAALLGAKLTCTIQEEHRINRFFWTNSLTVQGSPLMGDPL